mgnify:CR=1 FL=1
MIYRIRIILDIKDDVLRDLEIKSNSSFEDLHYAIVKAFNLDGNEMASFYLSDENWKQGEEITLESFGQEKVMKNCILNSEISDFQTNFIYVYDFLKLWTFFVEVVDESKEIASASYPQTIFTIGSIPKNAPEKIFIEDNSDFGDFDESNDEDPLDYY